MIALLAAAAVAASSDAGTRLAELQHLYSQSCEVRAYAAFDDLCGLLKKQMRDAERNYRKAGRTDDAAKPATPAMAETTEPAPAPTRTE